MQYQHALVRMRASLGVYVHLNQRLCTWVFLNVCALNRLSTVRMCACCFAYLHVRACIFVPLYVHMHPGPIHQLRTSHRAETEQIEPENNQRHLAEKKPYIQLWEPSEISSLREKLSSF